MYTKIEVVLPQIEMDFLNAMRDLITAEAELPIRVNNTAILVKMAQQVFEDIKLARAFVAVCRHGDTTSLDRIIRQTFNRVNRTAMAVHLQGYQHNGL
jgi:cob(I)alamin adenosyltransferase